VCVCLCVCFCVCLRVWLCMFLWIMWVEWPRGRKARQGRWVCLMDFRGSVAVSGKRSLWFAAGPRPHTGQPNPKPSSFPWIQTRRVGGRLPTKGEVSTPVGWTVQSPGALETSLRGPQWAKMTRRRKGGGKQPSTTGRRARIPPHQQIHEPDIAPPKNAQIALWANTRVVKYYVSKNNKIQRYNIYSLLFFIIRID